MQSPPTPPDRPKPPLIEQLRRQTPHLPVTLLLAGCNLAVFAAMLLNGAGLWHSPNNVQLAWGANFAPATEDGEWWRLCSAMFLHFGIVHLGLNMLALWESGHLVERMYGHGRFAAIYVFSGLVGNLLSLDAHGNSTVSGGASGAIFGLYGALLVFLALHRRNLRPREFKWMFWGAAALATLMILLGILIPGIDNAAHIGGLIAGALAGAALAPRTDATGAWRRTRAVAAAICLLLLIGLGAAIPPPKYRWSEEQQARDRIGRFLGDDQRISDRWSKILEQGRSGQASFQELATRIDSEVSSRYQANFEELAATPLSPLMPSAPTLEFLRDYSEARRDAAQALAEGLRSEDVQKINEALQEARNAATTVKERSVRTAPDTQSR
jgi:rhomboid protease GluP